MATLRVYSAIDRYGEIEETKARELIKFIMKNLIDENQYRLISLSNFDLSLEFLPERLSKLILVASCSELYSNFIQNPNIGKLRNINAVELFGISNFYQQYLPELPIRTYELIEFLIKLKQTEFKPILSEESKDMYDILANVSDKCWFGEIMPTQIQVPSLFANEKSSMMNLTMLNASLQRMNELLENY